jgi:hypothetical protein
MRGTGSSSAASKSSSAASTSSSAAAGSSFTTLCYVRHRRHVGISSASSRSCCCPKSAASKLSWADSLGHQHLLHPINPSDTLSRTVVRRSILPPTSPSCPTPLSRTPQRALPPGHCRPCLSPQISSLSSLGACARGTAPCSPPASSERVQHRGWRHGCAL